jgi:sugar/nucleoside kinase (ribokinase family)
MRVLCVGEVVVDFVCEQPVASVGEAPSFAPHLGGGAGVATIVAARRGGTVALAASAGQDPWGAWVRDRLEREGVDLEFFAQHEDVATPVAFVTLDPQARPTVAAYGDGRRSTIAMLPMQAAVDACDALYVTSATLVGEDERAVTLAARERAMAGGKPVIFDPGLQVADWRSASAAVEVLGGCVAGAFLVKAGATEARALTGESDPDAAARSLVAAGAQHAVVTLDDGGAVLRGGGLDRDVPSVPAVPVDTTGAGDVVAGVLIAALGRTGFYPAALAAMLPDAVAEAARATERYGSLG